MREAASPWNRVWITGASSGIGLELARLVAQHASHVAISARSADKLAQLEAEHGSIKSYPLDVTHADAVKTAVDTMVANGGFPDLAVLNAGKWDMMDAAEISAERVRAALDVNYMGVVNAIAALIPHMLQRGSGHITIVASVAGFRGLPQAAAYGPTKAALINLAETLRCDLKKHGIAVTIINPGFVDTPMTSVNSFPMPAMIPAREAARRIYKGLLNPSWEVSFPKRLVWIVKVLRVLPDPLYFWLINSVRKK